MSGKVYCYVDETGQHTQGRLFVVSVVVADWKRDALLETCEAIEVQTGKGCTKWIRTRYERRIAYIQCILNNSLFNGRLNFAVFRDVRDYSQATARTVAEAIRATGVADYRASVTIDCLPQAQERSVASALRQQGVRLRKGTGCQRRERGIGAPGRCALWLG